MDDKVIKQFVGWITSKYNLPNEKSANDFLKERSESEMEQLFASFQKDVQSMKQGGKVLYIECLKNIKMGKPCNCK